jgi:protein-disulfide isomerase
MQLKFAVPFPLRLSRARLALALLPLGLLWVAPAAHAQFGEPPTTPVHDASALKPPAGARVAIVEFEDLECPMCAQTNPLLKQAADQYHIPWIRHDFPLPMHNWSFQAAVNARFFDAKSQALGNEYRDTVFANQISIETPVELQRFTQRFADTHKIPLPTFIDPMGKLAEEVKADYALGQKIGIQHTPTIWIVTNAAHTAPFVEVVNNDKLYQIIDAAEAAAKK